MRIDDTVIPRNTPLYGLATISGMRLQVMVSSVEYGGRIFAVEAAAYDLDGQPGLNVPNSRERTALKEALASVGQTAGTSVNVTRSAGQQVLSELARGFHYILFYDCRLSHTHVVMCTRSVRLPTDRLHICLVLNDRPDAAL